jgi:molybdate transport system substrate-binding protein
LLLAGIASAADLRVFSGGAPQEALRRLAPEFEALSGHRVQFTFGLVTGIQRKLAAGEAADVILLPVPLLAATEKILPLRVEGRIVLARVGIGVIGRAGAAAPDVSSADAVRKMLVGARSIAGSDPGTPSGAHLNRMLAQLGIADEVRPKLTARAAIDGGAELVAKGEAEFGLYLVSEVQGTQGVTVAGLLPAALQSFVVYGTGVPASTANAEAALAFIKFISDPAHGDSWKAAGFELMNGLPRFAHQSAPAVDSSLRMHGRIPRSHRRDS